MSLSFLCDVSSWLKVTRKTALTYLRANMVQCIAIEVTDQGLPACIDFQLNFKKNVCDYDYRITKTYESTYHGFTGYICCKKKFEKIFISWNDLLSVIFCSSAILSNVYFDLAFNKYKYSMTENFEVDSTSR